MIWWSPTLLAQKPIWIGRNIPNQSFTEEKKHIEEATTRSPIHGGDQTQGLDPELTGHELESMALLFVAYHTVRCSASDLQTLH